MILTKSFPFGGAIGGWSRADLIVGITFGTLSLLVVLCTFLYKSNGCCKIIPPSRPLYHLAPRFGTCCSAHPPQEPAGAGAAGTGRARAAAAADLAEAALGKDEGGQERQRWLRDRQRRQE